MMNAHVARVEVAFTFVGVLPTGKTATDPKVQAIQLFRMVQPEVKGFVQVGRTMNVSINSSPVEVPEPSNPEK